MELPKDKESAMDQEKTHTSAGKWSVALAVISGGVPLLLYLLIMSIDNNSGESGLCALAAIGILLYFVLHVSVGTSLLGIFLGIFAVRKTKWRQGAAGFILNLSVLILAGTFLIDFYYGVSVNPDPDRLRIAAYHGKKRTVEKLLAKGFDINHEFRGDTALSVAVQGGKQQILELLLAKGADVNIGNPLGKAAGQGNIEIVQLLLEHGADPNCLIVVSGFHISAVSGGHKEIVELLLDHGADVNQKGENGRTPLHVAVTYGNKEIVKLLLDHGADVNQKNKQGRTPLHVAFTRGNKEIVKLLLDHGADVNARSKNGETPLHEIVKIYLQVEQFGDFRARVIVMLLDAGADIEAKTIKGKTPLHMAAEGIISQVSIKVLLEHGAKLANIEDFNVQFSLVPTSLDKKQLTKWMKANASDVNINNSRGESMLHWAVKGKNKSIVEVLLEMGVDVNNKNNSGDTALHWAMKEPIPEIVDSLAKYGANVNEQNNMGRTPLHILMEQVVRDTKSLNASMKTCEILITNGAKVGNEGNSPLKWLESLQPRKEAGRQYKVQLLQLMRSYQKK